MRMYPPAETRIPLSAFWGAILPSSRNFRSALCSYLGAENCTLANSGRALLYLLLSAGQDRHPERNEVLIPGYTCYAVASSVARAGLAIRPYDLDPKTLLPDMRSLKQRLSKRSLAIVVQHLFGMPTPVNETQTIAEEAGVILIEDAAQALGGSLNGSLLGTEGDFGLYSFGRGKPLPLGAGGALIGKDENLFQAMHFERRVSGIGRYAAGAAAQVLSKPHFYWIAEMLPLGLGETIFDPEFEVSSIEPMIERLGGRSLESLSDLNAHRARIAGIYRGALSEDFTVSLPMKAEPVYTRFPVLVKPGPLSSELRLLGVRRMYPKAIVDEETIRPFLADGQALTPGATQIARNLLTLPTHKAVSEELAQKIAIKINTLYS